MTTALLTNKAYGYPDRGDQRRMAPRRLVCIHATYNPNTPLATAQQERDYANRTGSNGPSAHSYLNRDGTFVHAIDPVKYAAWSIETCGRYPDFPITAEQRQALAEQIAKDSLTTGLPIQRATVHLHSDLDTEQRPNCPVPAKEAEAWVADIIRAARETRLQLELDEANERIGQLETTLTYWIGSAETAEAQRDEAVEWGKRLQAFGGAILATDKPEWVA